MSGPGSASRLVEQGWRRVRRPGHFGDRHELPAVSQTRTGPCLRIIPALRPRRPRFVCRWSDRPGPVRRRQLHPDGFRHGRYLWGWQRIAASRRVARHHGHLRSARLGLQPERFLHRRRAVRALRAQCQDRRPHRHLQRERLHREQPTPRSGGRMVPHRQPDDAHAGDRGPHLRLRQRHLLRRQQRRFRCACRSTQPCSRACQPRAGCRGPWRARAAGRRRTPALVPAARLSVQG